MNLNPATMLGSNVGSWYLELDDLTFEITGTTVPTIYLGNDSNENLALVARATGNNKFVFLVKEEAGTSITIHSFTFSSLTKIMFVWNGSTLKAFVNGSQVYSANDFANFSNWDDFTFNRTSREALIELNQTMLFPTALTDQEAIDLTTI